MQGICAPLPEDLSHTVLPGVAELLAGDDGLRLALLTGNYEPVARLKLRRRHRPPLRGAPGRLRLRRRGARAAAGDRRERAGAAAGRPSPRERTVVIGDTPRDVACAQADEVRCIGVATGRFSAAELAAAGADAVAASAGEIPALLSRWLDE